MIKKRIVIPTDSFLPRWDGIARFLEQVIPEIEKDYDITVIAPDYEGIYKDRPNIKIIRVPLLPLTLGDYKPAKSAKHLMEEEIKKCDIVWTNTTATIATAGVELARKYKKKHIAYVHSIDWQLVKRALSKANPLKGVIGHFTKNHVAGILGKANLIMVPSLEVQEILRWYQIYAPTRVVKLGVDTTEFVPAPSKIEAKRKLGFDETAPIVGYVGRIAYEKDLLTLLRAFMRLQHEFANVKLLIVGEGVTKLKKELAQKDVILMGARDNPVPYLQAMDMHVLPSLIETTSLATLEAMSCETPIISTKAGLIKHYIMEKENGLLFPTGNDTVLTLKMKWVLQNHRLAKEMAKKGRLTVEHHHEWSETIDKIKAILKSL